MIGRGAACGGKRGPAGPVGYSDGREVGSIWRYFSQSGQSI